jgi:hypothetical protein
MVRNVLGNDIKKGGNALQATDLKRRNKSSASLIKKNPPPPELIVNDLGYAALLGGGIDPLASLFVGGRHPDKKLSSAGLCNCKYVIMYSKKSNVSTVKSCTAMY